MRISVKYEGVGHLPGAVGIQFQHGAVKIIIGFGPFVFDKSCETKQIDSVAHFGR